VLACGRRWGKTDAAAADLAGRIATASASKQIAIAPTIAQARIVFDRVVWMLTAAGVAFTPLMTPYPSLKVFDQGDKKGPVVHILDARSGHDARLLRGQGADHILIDEAAFVAESTITEVAMPMLATSGGRMTLISTPFGKNHFYRFYQYGERGEHEFWSRSGASSENPHVDRNYLLTQQNLLSESAFAAEYLAEFSDSNATVFGYEFIQAALSAPKVDSGFVAVGVDWGRKRDYTAVTAVRGTQLRAEILETQTWRRMPWSKLVANAADFVRRHRAGKVSCDATGVGDCSTEQLAEVAGSTRIESVCLTSKTKSGLIQSLVWMLEQGRLRLPGDVELIREMESFEARQTEGYPKYGAPFGHDDRVCALALACAALPRGGTITIKGKERN
jgi:phage FluMu gp28-like protein